MNKLTPAEQILIAQRALRGCESLPIGERVALLNAVAKVLPKAEAEAARATAWVLRTADDQQGKFLELLAPASTRRNEAA